MWRMYTRADCIQVFSQTELGDRTLSQLLSAMGTLVGNAVVEDTNLQQLWMRCFPFYIHGHMLIIQQGEEVWPGETCWEKAARNQGWHDRSLLLQLGLVPAYIDGLLFASPGSAPNYYKLLEMQPYSARNRLPRPSYRQSWYFTKAEKHPNQLWITPF